MKFKEWIKKYAKEILLGVIVSVSTTVILKGADWVAEIAPTAGNSLWRFFSNSFFSSAAKMTETSLIMFLLSALIGVSIAYVYSYLIKALSITRKAIVDAADILGDIDNLKPEAQHERKEITTDEVKNKAEDVIKRAKKIRRTTIAVIIFFAFYFGHIFVFNCMPHGVWAAYQRDLLKIAPYIEQQELIQIKSDWACMQSKEDYDKIYEQISKIKNEHALP